MKKTLSGFVYGTLLSVAVLSLPLSALAVSGRATIEVDPVNIQVNGAIFRPTDVNGNEVPVFAYHGTTYAPVRALAEAYGLDVWYDASTNLAAVGPKGSAPGSTPSASTEPVNIPVPYIYNATGGQNSVSVSWEPVTGVSGYEIHQGLSTSGSYRLAKTVEGSSADSATIAELEAGTSYYFKVRAYIDRNGERDYGGFSSAAHAMTLADQGFSLEVKNTLPVTIGNTGGRTASFSNVTYGTSVQPTGIRLNLTFSGTIIEPGRYTSAPVANAVLYERDSGAVVDTTHIFAGYATRPGDTFTATGQFSRLKDIPYVLELVGQG